MLQPLRQPAPLTHATPPPSPPGRAWRCWRQCIRMNVSRTFGSCFRLQALPPACFAWLPANVLGCAALTTLMKRVYPRRYGWQ